MKFPGFRFATVAITVLCYTRIITGSTSGDFASDCYREQLHDLLSSSANRTVPWGRPSITNADNTTCCSSLDEVRVGIDEIDTQLLNLLSQRTEFVREATRFKASRNVVDVPSRDQQVVDGAVADAPGLDLPQTIAKAVFTAIINSNVPFEMCIFDSFSGEA
ncbi:chorismate mutase [Cyathus striatus]|nr:chorismate mutase [Cyathus striatus]